jgi:hypothetical protein
MKYMLLMYMNEADQPTTPEVLQAAGKAWAEFLKEGAETGAVLSSHGVAPGSNASTVRVREGKTLIADGPFAETHEQLAGAIVVECPDIDEAIRWAAKIPHAKYGAVEIQPLWSPPK